MPVPCFKDNMKCLCKFSFRRNLEFFQSSQLNAMNATDADHGNGELLVRLPSEAYGIIAGAYDCDLLQLNLFALA